MTAARATSKNQIVELIVLALGESKLKDLGLGAMRGVLQSDPRLAVLDGAVDLQSVWELLESQPGFTPEAAYGPFAFLKTLEPKLQVTFKLPAPLASLAETDIIRYAGTCRPKRDDVDKALRGEESSKPRPPAKQDTTLPMWTSVPPPPPVEELTTKRKVLAAVSALVVVASLVIVGWSIFGGVAGEPRFKKIDTALFAGEIPLRSAETWGGEVHASLSDPSWLSQPEDKRRKQLEGAVQRLADQQASVLIIQDDANRTRATAQVYGKPPKVFIRFF